MSGALEVLKPDPAQVPSVGQMLQLAIDKGVSAKELETLCGLYERMQDREAQHMFAIAFCDMQKELTPVQATKAVPNNDGSTRYKYAPYADIMKQLQPLLSKHGFSVRFSSRVDEARIIMFCTLLHVGGHAVTNEFSVRIGKGPPGSSESQADGSAAQYAQRGALCDSLNISVRIDDDARNLGAPITPEQAKELGRRVMDTASDLESFLKYAGAKSFETIPAARYSLLDASLRRKERVVP
jgi:hypothetical protein